MDALTEEEKRVGIDPSMGNQPAPVMSEINPYGADLGNALRNTIAPAPTQFIPVQQYPNAPMLTEQEQQKNDLYPKALELLRKPQEPEETQLRQTGLPEQAMQVLRKDTSTSTPNDKFINKAENAETEEVNAQKRLLKAQSEKQQLIVDERNRDALQQEQMVKNEALNQQRIKEQTDEAYGNAQRTMQEWKTQSQKDTSEGGFYKQLGPGGSIGLSIAAALGAFGSGMTHSPNQVSDMINKSIDRWVNSERYKAESLGKLADAQNNLWARLTQQGYNSAQTASLMKGMAHDATKSRIEALTTDSPPEVVDRGLIEINKQIKEAAYKNADAYKSINTTVSAVPQQSQMSAKEQEDYNARIYNKDVSSDEQVLASTKEAATRFKKARPTFMEIKQTASDLDHLMDEGAHFSSSIGDTSTRAERVQAKIQDLKASMGQMIVNIYGGTKEDNPTYQKIEQSMKGIDPTSLWQRDSTFKSIVQDEVAKLAKMYNEASKGELPQSIPQRDTAFKAQKAKEKLKGK